MKVPAQLWCPNESIRFVSAGGSFDLLKSTDWVSDDVGLNRTQAVQTVEGVEASYVVNFPRGNVRHEIRLTAWRAYASLTEARKARHARLAEVTSSQGKLKCLFSDETGWEYESAVVSDVSAVLGVSGKKYFCGTTYTVMAGKVTAVGEPLALSTEDEEVLTTELEEILLA